MSESWWFEVLIFIVPLAATLCIVLATWFDLRRIRLHRRRNLRLSRRPPVTVIIDAHDSKGLDSCLRNIRRLRYRNYDVVVTVPSTSSREEKRAIRNAAVGCIVYMARTPTARDARIRSAYRRSRRGEIVLLLDASQALAASSLSPSIRTLQENATAGTVFGPMLEQPTSVHGLGRFLGSLTWRFIMKAASVAQVYRSDALLSGRLVWHEVLTKPARYRYAFDSDVGLSGVRISDRPLLRALGYVAAAVSCVVMIYIGTLAAQLQTTEPLWLVWTIVTLWLAVAIWLDDSLRFWQRAEYTLYLPVSYFVVMGALIVGIFQTIPNRQILGFMRRISHTA